MLNNPNLIEKFTIEQFRHEYDDQDKLSQKKADDILEEYIKCMNLSNVPNIKNLLLAKYLGTNGGCKNFGIYRILDLTDQSNPKRLIIKTTKYVNSAEYDDMLKIYDYDNQKWQDILVKPYNSGNISKTYYNKYMAEKHFFVMEEAKGINLKNLLDKLFCTGDKKYADYSTLQQRHSDIKKHLSNVIQFFKKSIKLGFKHGDANLGSAIYDETTGSARWIDYSKSKYDVESSKFIYLLTFIPIFHKIINSACLSSLQESLSTQTSDDEINNTILSHKEMIESLSDHLLNELYSDFSVKIKLFLMLTEPTHSKQKKYAFNLLERGIVLSLPYIPKSATEISHDTVPDDYYKKDGGQYYKYKINDSFEVYLHDDNKGKITLQIESIFIKYIDLNKKIQNIESNEDAFNLFKNYSVKSTEEVKAVIYNPVPEVAAINSNPVPAVVAAINSNPVPAVVAAINSNPVPAVVAAVNSNPVPEVHHDHVKENISPFGFKAKAALIGISAIGLYIGYTNNIGAVITNLNELGFFKEIAMPVANFCYNASFAFVEKCFIQTLSQHFELCVAGASAMIMLPKVIEITSSVLNKIRESEYFNSLTGNSNAEMIR